MYIDEDVINRVFARMKAMTSEEVTKLFKESIENPGDLHYAFLNHREFVNWLPDMSFGDLECVTIQHKNMFVSTFGMDVVWETNDNPFINSCVAA